MSWFSPHVCRHTARLLEGGSETLAPRAQKTEGSESLAVITCPTTTGSEYVL